MEKLSKGTQSKYLNVDEIRSLLGIPEFTGFKVHQFQPQHIMNAGSPTSREVDFSHIPDEIKVTHPNGRTTMGAGDKEASPKANCSKIFSNRKILSSAYEQEKKNYIKVFSNTNEEPKTNHSKVISDRNGLTHNEEPKANNNKALFNNNIYASGDNAAFHYPKQSASPGENSSKVMNNFVKPTKVWNAHSPSNHPENFMMKLDPDILSGYDEYMKTFGPTSEMQREFCGMGNVGQLRITPQATLSLTLCNNLQVDVTIDGAVRIINPKVHVAMSVNGMGTHTAVMHPMGRLLQESSTANLMAYDTLRGSHKFAKLWPQKATFKSTDMTFSYTMDMAGTRTTMTAFPNMPSNDISLPVFYATSRHGVLYREEVGRAFKKSTQSIDTDGSTVWNINGVIIKYFQGDVRVLTPSRVFLHTSAVAGNVGLSTESVHCTATQGDLSHLFVRFGASKMHYNGREFKLRTLSQAAGFDENNRITLF